MILGPLGSRHDPTKIKDLDPPILDPMDLSRIWVLDFRVRDHTLETQIRPNDLFTSIF